MAIAPAIPLIIGALIAAAGTAVAVQSARSAAASRKALAERAAEIAKQNADRAVFRSTVKAQDEDRLSKILAAQNEADRAATGLSLRSGSFTLARNAENQIASLNRRRIIQGGQVEAANFLNQEAGFDAAAKQADREGRDIAVGGGLSIAGGLVGAAGGLISPAASLAPQRSPTPVSRPSTSQRL